MTASDNGGRPEEVAGAGNDGSPAEASGAGNSGSPAKAEGVGNSGQSAEVAEGGNGSSQEKMAEPGIGVRFLFILGWITRKDQSLASATGVSQALLIQHERGTCHYLEMQLRSSSSVSILSGAFLLPLGCSMICHFPLVSRIQRGGHQ